jgi:hypothetical protein
MVVISQSSQANDHSREQLWVNLAKAFIDDDVDYDSLSDIDPAELKDILFKEVALYCGAQMLSTTPPTFEGFDEDEMIADIHEKLSKRDSSFLSRLVYFAKVNFYRLNYNYVWNSIAKNLPQLHLKS